MVGRSPTHKNYTLGEVSPPVMTLQLFEVTCKVPEPGSNEQ